MNPFRHSEGIWTWVKCSQRRGNLISLSHQSVVKEQLTQVLGHDFTSRKWNLTWKQKCQGFVEPLLYTSFSALKWSMKAATLNDSQYIFYLLSKSKSHRNVWSMRTNSYFQKIGQHCCHTIRAFTKSVQNKPTTTALKSHMRQSYSYVLSFLRAVEIRIQLWI